MRLLDADAENEDDREVRLLSLKEAVSFIKEESAEGFATAASIPDEPDVEKSLFGGDGRREAVHIPAITSTTA